MPNISVETLAKQLVVDQGGTTIDPTDVALFGSWVSEVCTSIAAAADWLFFRQTEALSLTATIATYALQASGAEITGIRIASQKAFLRATSKEFLLSRRLDLDIAGLPVAFYPAGFDSANGQKQITFWPVPDTTYSAEVTEVTRVSELTATSIIPFPDEFIPLIKDGVRVKALEADERFEAADRALRRFATDLDARIARYTRERSRVIRRREADVPNNSNWLLDPVLDPSHYPAS